MPFQIDLDIVEKYEDILIFHRQKQLLLHSTEKFLNAGIRRVFQIQAKPVVKVAQSKSKSKSNWESVAELNNFCSQMFFHPAWLI